MKLNSLSVSNFKAIKSFDFTANGHNVNIFGDNGKGKTSVFDAFSWLLFGKDSAGRKEFDFKFHDETGAPVTGKKLEPLVEAGLEQDGRNLMLKKVYAEQWVKPQGKAVKEYRGSVTEYYVDGLKVKAGEYQAAVDALIQENIFKLITNPHYLPGLKPDKQREFLVMLAGELNVPVPKELAGLMGYLPFEKFYALQKQNLKEKSKERDTLPAVISEAQRNIPDIQGDPKKIWIDAGKLKVRQAEIENDIRILQSSGSEETRRRSIAETENLILEARNRYTKILSGKNGKVQAKIDSLVAEQSELEISKRRLTSDLSDISERIKRYESNVKDMRDQYKEAAARKWDGNESCPTCGRPLPPEEIEKAREQFNINKSNQLQQINAEGKSLKSALEDLLSEHEKKSGSLPKIESDIATLSERIQKGKSMLTLPDFEQTKEYKALSDKLQTLHSDSSEEPNNDNVRKIDSLREEVQSLQTRIEQMTEQKIRLEQKSDQEKRVAELIEQESKANEELETIEKNIFLCEEYRKAKSHALESAVNGKFKLVRFKLFETLKTTGEEVETCEAVYTPNGTGYCDVSRSQTTYVGIDICNAFMEHFGVTAPLFVDDAEGVLHELDTDAQVIRLIASLDDKNLRAEVL
ncbi:MAG TPA: hypothetical protein VHR42_04085 [Clostridia bacterium]|nr:hypothetical protein [Clostridia bacterium]